MKPVKEFAERVYESMKLNCSGQGVSRPCACNRTIAVLQTWVVVLKILVKKEPLEKHFLKSEPRLIMVMLGTGVLNNYRMH